MSSFYYTLVGCVSVSAFERRIHTNEQGWQRWKCVPTLVRLVCSRIWTSGLWIHSFAVRCSVLQCVAVCCSALRESLEVCAVTSALSVLKNTELGCVGFTHCNTLQHTATLCSTPQHTATHYNTLQHTSAQSCLTYEWAMVFSERVMCPVYECVMLRTTHVRMYNVWYDI